MEEGLELRHNGFTRQPLQLGPRNKGSEAGRELSNQRNVYFKQQLTVIYIAYNDDD